MGTRMCGNLGTYRGLEREKKMLTEDMFYNFGEDEMVNEHRRKKTNEDVVEERDSSSCPAMPES